MKHQSEPLSSAEEWAAAAQTAGTPCAFPSLSSKLNTVLLGASAWFLYWSWQILTYTWENHNVRLVQ